MEKFILNYSPTVMFRGTLCIIILWTRTSQKSHLQGGTAAEEVEHLWLNSLEEGQLGPQNLFKNTSIMRK